MYFVAVSSENTTALECFYSKENGIEVWGTANGASAELITICD